jgi:hypothetical protein
VVVVVVVVEELLPVQPQPGGVGFVAARHMTVLVLLTFRHPILQVHSPPQASRHAL